MALNLINSYGQAGINYGLYNLSADVVDTNYLSQFFVVTEFNPTLTAGKNSFSFNGSTYLKQGSQIFVECIDSNNDALYIEVAKTSDVSVSATAYQEAGSFVFAIYVFGDTYNGVGHLTLYGTLIDGRSVKWSQNVLINKTIKNSSKVRFYQSPTFDVQYDLIPILSSSVTSLLTTGVLFTGSVVGFAVNPQKDTNLSSINKSNTDIDYRLTLVNPLVDNNTTPDTSAFNSQIVGSTIILNINSIQVPLTTQEINISQTASYTVINVIDNNTLQIGTPYYASDEYNNSTVTNITNANFYVTYSYVNYILPPIQYQTTTINGITYINQGSYANVTYGNIRTFTGYVASYKIYGKSLVSGADWALIANGPVAATEELMDDITQNKYYDLLGQFYNQPFINNYWFSSTPLMSLQYSPLEAVNSAVITTETYSQLTGNDYFIVKSDSVSTNRDAVYVPYDPNQFQAEYGPAYDSNFIELNANVQYVIEVSAVVLKDQNETGASLMFYFTSSVPQAQQEMAYTQQFGISLSSITASFIGKTFNVQNFVTFFTPQNDLYGTLVVVPTLCNAVIEGISIRTYGDDGFSPDIFETTVPWPVSTGNETYEIKSELYDINNTLVYSNLSTIQSFDPQGASVVPYIPGTAGGNGSYANLIVSGNLTVNQSSSLNGPVVIQGPTVINNSVQINNQPLFLPNIPPRPTDLASISQSRFLSVRSDGAIVFNPVVDTSFDDKYLYLSVDGSPNRLDPNITTKHSIVTEYSEIGGRSIYWSNGTKVVETAP